MRILLFGEYSNVHATLALGLRKLGHEVLVVSDGDGWKDYPRDIDISRKGCGKWDTLRYLFRLARVLRRLSVKPRDRQHQYCFDVIHIINPLFVELKPSRALYVYRYIRRLAKIVTMGAYGMDYYWIKSCIPPTPFRYSDFFIGETPRHCQHNSASVAEWYHGPKGTLTQYVAADVDGIVSGLYEYDVAYRQFYPEKTRFIPFPIVPCSNQSLESRHDAGEKSDRVPRFFIGIQRARSEYKGTDVMLRALERAQRDYPDRMVLLRAENVPFSEYKQMYNQADVLLDQLYCYTPAMGALQAMAQGLVVVGGGESENYEILGEEELRPIINVLPDEEDVYAKICDIIAHPDRLQQLKLEGIEYIKRHHDYIAVAQKYVEFWNSL